ncbi:hypothetical protein [Microbacterium karelineae]|uniref:hypothetical protein n=1 Tax=Microbacterium karelineae TaxID=2654283 RepID=UPI0012EA6ECB|nr:hypothetical protein [Microbacterium karelineae]
MDDAALSAVARAAGRAPSAHNAQPWRVRQTADGFDVGLDGDRLLREGDPTGRDALLGLGCWIEAAAIAAAERGLALRAEAVDGALRAFDADPATAPEDPLVRAHLEVGEAATPFTSADVDRRAVYRGRLVTSGDAGMPDALGEPWLRLLRVPPGASARLIAAGDAGSAGRPAIARETVDWLRFTSRDPRFHRDGLTAPALLIPPRAARVAAAVTARPVGRRAFAGALAAASRLAPLTARGGHPGLFVLVADHAPSGRMWPRGPEPGDVVRAGRALLRAWLAAHRAGWAVAPASQVIDGPRAHAALRRGLRLATSSSALAVFAAGAPDAAPPRSPRLVDRHLHASG